MASKTLSLNKLISSDFSEGSSWVLNKGGGGDTDTGYFVFNSLGVSQAHITGVSFKINAIETGGNNLFAENIYLNFEFGKYEGSTFTSATGFDFSQQGVKESQNQISITASSTRETGTILPGDKLCVKLTITPQSNSIGSKIVMSGFSLAVTYNAVHTLSVITPPANEGLAGVTANHYPSMEYWTGRNVGLYAEPNTGYKFIGWYKNGVLISTENPYSFSMPDADETYTAKFEKPPPKFTSAEMRYLDKQISLSNKVICNEGFILSVGVT